MYKKILTSIILSLFLVMPSFAYDSFSAFGDYSDCETIEHLTEKNAKINLVKITQSGSVIQKENLLVVNFAQNFNSKYYVPGDYVQFNFDNEVKTQEGTLLIPENSSLIARITSIEDPRWFSRNAKVYMEFTHILFSDGTNIPIFAEKAGKKEYFQEGAKETIGKIGAHILAVGGAGSGLGAAVGVAAGNTITGLIVGGSVGGGVGIVSGIVSPGLHYKAKKGEKVMLEIKDNLKLPNNVYL